MTPCGNMGNDNLSGPVITHRLERHSQHYFIKMVLGSALHSVRI